MSLHGSTAMTRELGHEMRRRRVAAGLTLADVSQTLGWSISRTSRIETGLASISDVELTHYLAHVGSSLAETRELVQSRQGGDRGHWLSPHGTGLEDSLRSLVFHESLALAKTMYQPLVVPGLVQTEEYARAMISRESWRTAENIESCVRGRMDRQVVLRRGLHLFYVHEQALRIQVGNAKIMHEQLLKLALMAESKHVRIRVVPLRAGERSVFGSSFSLFDYKSGRPLLYLDNFAMGMFFEDPRYADPYIKLMPAISRVALNPQETQELLVALAGDYEREAALAAPV